MQARTHDLPAPEHPSASAGFASMFHHAWLRSRVFIVGIKL